MSEGAGGPLAGLKVLEVGTVIMAPYAGKIFADMGASVVKAEPPGGDIGRGIGLLSDGGESLLSLNINAGKKSITLDFTDSFDSGVLRRLIEWSDLIVTNVLPKRRARFGLDWETVNKLNARAILVTAQGWASESERGDRPAYDDVIQAASGLSDTYRLRGGEPGYSPYVVADKVCGMSMVQAGLAALYQRERTGVGSWADVPMMDTLAAFTLLEHLGGSTLRPERGPVGWPRVLNAEHKPHPSTDGWVCIMPYTDANWRSFCEMSGHPEYLDEPDLRTLADRHARPARYEEVLTDYASTRSTAQIEDECAAFNIPIQRVNRIEDLLDDDYLRSRPVIRHASDERAGEYTLVGSPVDFHADPAPLRPYSYVNDDREDILRSLGIQEV